MERIAWLTALALISVAAFSAVASATTITSPTDTAYDGKITAYDEGGHVTIHGSFGVEVECETHLAGDIVVNGTANPTLSASVAVEELAIFGCTNDYTKHVLNNASGNKGTLSIDSSGQLRGTGQTINSTTPLGITCEYTTNNTSLGTVTDSHDTGSTATLDIDALLPRTGGSFLCGATGVLTGNLLLEATESESDRLYLD